MKEWRCFHCDEVFTDERSAMDHFGPHQGSDPACQIDVAEYRRMEENNRRHCEEDTELHRVLHAKSAEIGTAVRQAEEVGYARGLEDAKKHPNELGLQRDDARQQRIIANFAHAVLHILDDWAEENAQTGEVAVEIPKDQWVELNRVIELLGDDPHDVLHDLIGVNEADGA